MVGLGLGAVIARFTQQVHQGTFPRGDRIFRTIIFTIMVTLLTVSWFVTINSLTAPDPWIDDHAQLFTFSVLTIGGALLGAPLIEFIFAPHRRRHAHRDKKSDSK